MDLGFAETFTIGGTAGVISKTATAPIERVKLLIQNQNEMIKAGRLDRPFKGVIDCTTWVYTKQGFLSFWRSNFVNCIRYFPSQALNFAFKEKFQTLFKSGKKESHVLKLSKNVAAGSAAGVVTLCFVYSLDYARTRLANDTQSGTRQFNGFFDVYRKTLKTDGVVGLYRGFIIASVFVFVYRGLYFGLYDTLKPVLFGEDAGLLSTFALGYAVTVSAGLLCYPIDTIRRRMMMTSIEAVRYKGSIDCANQIIKNEGFMSLMKGAGVNILRGVAGAGVLAGFDKFKEIYIAWRLSSTS